MSTSLRNISSTIVPMICSVSNNRFKFDTRHITQEIQAAETAILRSLRPFRKRSAKGAMMDRLQHITVDEAYERDKRYSRHKYSPW
jgi:hypothetical protein